MTVCPRHYSLHILPNATSGMLESCSSRTVEQRERDSRGLNSVAYSRYDPSPNATQGAHYSASQHRSSAHHLYLAAVNESCSIMCLRQVAIPALLAPTSASICTCWEYRKNVSEGAEETSEASSRTLPHSFGIRTTGPFLQI